MDYFNENFVDEGQLERHIIELNKTKEDISRKLNEIDREIQIINAKFHNLPNPVVRTSSGTCASNDFNLVTSTPSESPIYEFQQGGIMYMTGDARDENAQVKITITRVGSTAPAVYEASFNAGNNVFTKAWVIDSDTPFGSYLVKLSSSNANGNDQMDCETITIIR